MRLVFTPNGWDDYTHWLSADRATLKRINRLIDDALSIQMAALQRQGIVIMRELASLPRAQVDKHKVLQILINLITNAKNAMASLPSEERRLWLRLERHRLSGGLDHGRHLRRG